MARRDTLQHESRLGRSPLIARTRRLSQQQHSECEKPIEVNVPWEPQIGRVAHVDSLRQDSWRSSHEWQMAGRSKLSHAIRVDLPLASIERFQPYDGQYLCTANERRWEEFSLRSVRPRGIPSTDNGVTPCEIGSLCENRLIVANRQELQR